MGNLKPGNQSSWGHLKSGMGEARWEPVPAEEEPSALEFNTGAFSPEQQSQRAEGPSPRLPGCAFRGVYH